MLPLHLGALAILLPVFAISFGPLQARAQTGEAFRDKVFLDNGDLISGKIKELDRGQLRIKTATIDTIYVNWVDMNFIESSTYLRIAETDGTFVYGRLRKSELARNVRILTDREIVDIPTVQVANMKPLRVDESFLNRIEGDASAGIDYKKASGRLLVNVESNLRFCQENTSWNSASTGMNRGAPKIVAPREPI
ncbi:MAG: hypothetical protein OEW68_04610 [Gammaproteobacteria bacterium]|nr:hypothetical protein [Gammaproteobacteria bacterium]MDH4314104.1 hypothetical protein [Gammaproteobacteria bacterium]MDH5213147.1 hypothetical protein [Gammaproteobacteria bacterium]MDH5501856.1 hypothetical protein [Gammaproteobacteria bacterium]